LRILATAKRPKVLKALIRSEEKPPHVRPDCKESSMKRFWTNAISLTPRPGSPPEMGAGKKRVQILETDLKIILPNSLYKQLRIVIGLASCIDVGHSFLERSIVFAIIMEVVNPFPKIMLKIRTKSSIQTLGRHLSSSFDQPHGPTALPDGSFFHHLEPCINVLHFKDDGWKSRKLTIFKEM